MSNSAKRYISELGLVGGGLLALGALLIVISIAVPNATYCRILVSDTKDLSWGPTLFRCLMAIHGVLVATFALRRGKPGPAAQTLDEADQRKDAQKITPRIFLILAAFSVVGFILRVWNLNSDLWIDEVFTLLDFVRQPMGTIVTSFPSQNQHMLFSLLAHLSTILFGESSWAIRLPSVIFGIGSIWAFFFLARHLFGNREALLGCALMTASYHHIWFSQNARGYMGLLLFTLLATLCWLEALNKNTAAWWSGYTVSVVLGMWIHPTMAFVVAAHGLVHLILLAFPKLAGDENGRPSPERRVGLSPFFAWILSVTITLQLYALALPEFLSIGLHEVSKPSEWTNPLWVVTESILALKIGFGGIFVVVLAAAFVGFGWLMLFRAKRRAAAAMILPALLAGGLMLMLGHNIWPRFFFFSMGFGLLIVIHGATELPRAIAGFLKPLKVKKAFVSPVGTGLALLVVAASVVTVPKNYLLPKQDFSGARNYVEREKSRGDGIVAVSLAGVVYGRYLMPPWPVATTASELENIQSTANSQWLVYTLPIEIKAFKPELWKVIERDYSVVKVFPGTLNGGEVVVCRKKG